MQLTALRVLPEQTDIKAIQALYEEAFPANERIVWERLLHHPPYVDFFAYYDQQQLVGLTYCYRKDGLVWWFYFAVSPHLRGKGYGTAILQQIKETYNNGVLMMDIEDPEEKEAPNKQQRIRRQNFYLRMGFNKTEAAKSFDGVRMVILARGGTVSQATYEQMLGHIWNDFFDEDN